MNLKFSPRALLFESEIEIKYKSLPVIDKPHSEAGMLTSFLQFESIKPSVFFLNLQLLDSELPQIISDIILLQKKHQKSKTSELLALIEKENPRGYNQENGHPYYRKKISDFLFHIASGMSSETVWNGECNSFINFVIESEQSNYIYFHTHNLNMFRDYLINNTKFEQASIIKEESNGAYFFKMNLQIRFT